MDATQVHDLKQLEDCSVETTPKENDASRLQRRRHSFSDFVYDAIRYCVV